MKETYPQDYDAEKEEGYIDFIISDLDMPEMDGIQMS